jgi:hypothetical protein
MAPFHILDKLWQIDFCQVETSDPGDELNVKLELALTAMKDDHITGLLWNYSHNTQCGGG